MRAALTKASGCCYRHWLRIFCACLFGLGLQVIAQQPAGTYNVKSEGTAKGDGSANDTAAIQNALNEAKKQGKNVYFPPGTYIVSQRISLPSGIRIYGDRTRVSTIKAIEPYQDVRIAKDDGATGHLRVEDIDPKSPSAPYLKGTHGDMARYEAMEIPFLIIPSYGAAPVENHPPVFTSTPGSARFFDAGKPYTYPIAATDADGQPLVISAAVLPSWLALTSTGNGRATLTGIPPASTATSHPSSLRVSDGITSREQSFVIRLK